MRAGDLIGPALLSLATWAGEARGDGGTLRAFERRGDCDIAVFTEPSPLVTGPVDVSVLALDRDTGEPIEGSSVTVEVSPVGRPAGAIRHVATRQAATNKLLHAALFELRHAGRYDVEVRVDGPKEQVQVRFEVDVGAPWSPRAGIWPWILWPLPVIGLYAIHRRKAEASRRRLHPQAGRRGG